MTDRELRKLSRSDLLEMLVDLSEEHNLVKQQLKAAEEKLNNRQIMIDNAGSIAEASLQLNGVYEAAEAASEQYMENIRSLSQRQDEICRRIEWECREQAKRRLEEAAFRAGGGNFRAPAQLVGDLLEGTPSTAHRSIVPTYRPGVTYTDLSTCLPDFILDSIRQALPILDRKLHGFAHPDAVLTAVESRSSSPIRILRNEAYESSLSGLYPCGEGAGYAGGILSAAADGMRCAEKVLEVFR